MKVSNIRLGHATNSSSSHSIVFESWRSRTDEVGSGLFEFGWDNFELTSVEDKLCYLAVATWDTLSRSSDLPKELLEVVWRELFKDTPAGDLIARHIEAGKRSRWADRYIDHQSAFTLPATAEALTQRVREFVEVFSDPRVAIYGGNDNDYRGYSGNGPALFNADDYSVAPRVRKDGDSIVVYNRSSGAKVRFGDGPHTKAVVPELVDLKLTDKCPYGCEFCYQGSTPGGAEGKHISEIILALAELGVFEIAFGGGEPTHAANFYLYVKYAHGLGVTPNFTTFGVDWLKNEDIVKAARLCGGIGVSVGASADLGKVERIRTALHGEQKESTYWRRINGPSVQAQHVVGTEPLPVLADIIAQCRALSIPLLLLGYKHTGRGKDFVPHDMDGISKVLADAIADGKAKGDFRLSVDTAFVDRHAPLLGALSVPEVLITSPEGKFSMYIDAVTQRMGPSSYCPEESYVKLPPIKYNETEPLKAEILNAFAKW